MEDNTSLIFPLFKLTRSYNAYEGKKKALSASHKDYLSNTDFIYRFMFLGEGLAYTEERRIRAASTQSLLWWLTESTDFCNSVTSRYFNGRHCLGPNL